MSARVTESESVANKPTSTEFFVCVCVCFLAKWHKQLEEM